MTAPALSTYASLFDLTGRSAVVTGASSGLGRRFAQVLADHGATVYAAARREERLRDLAETNQRIQPVATDVAVEADRVRLVEHAAAQTAGVDVLVNCAGVPGGLAASDESPEDIARVLEVNVVAAQRLACLAVSRAGRALSIVNVASILGLVAGAPMGGASYTASKGAVIAMTRELAAQWGPAGVRVNALAPGWFESEMTVEAFEDERTASWLARNTMLRRTGTPGEIDGALLFLSSQASSYMTGQTLVVDGGWTAR